jgi:hypothetical protein
VGLQNHAGRWNPHPERSGSLPQVKLASYLQNIITRTYAMV